MPFIFLSPWLQSGKKVRHVRHFQFTSWPDHGVPETPTPVIDFVQTVRAQVEMQHGPIVVHCRWGGLTVECKVQRSKLGERRIRGRERALFMIKNNMAFVLWVSQFFSLPSLSPSLLLSFHCSFLLFFLTPFFLSPSLSLSLSLLSQCWCGSHWLFYFTGFSATAH